MKHMFTGVMVPAMTLLPLMYGLCRRCYCFASCRTLLWYLSIALATNVIERIIGALHHNNLPLLHLYTLIEGVLLLQFYGHVLEGKIWKQRILFFKILLAGICVLDAFYYHSLWTFNTYARPAAALMITALALYVLADQIKKQEQFSPLEQSLAWLNSGVLMYFMSSLLYFSLLNPIVRQVSDSLWFVIGHLHAFFEMVMYLLFTVGFYYAKHDR